jgi:hypothetical protein
MAQYWTTRRLLACSLVGLGAMLLVAAVLIPTYTLHKLSKIPLDLEMTTVAQTPDGLGADVLDMSTLTSDSDGSAHVDHNVPLIAQRFITVEDKSNAAVVTLQAGYTLRRNDMQGDTGMLTATVDRVTLNRRTAMPVDSPIGSIQVAALAPAAEVAHTGLQYVFPFHTKEISYPFFDTTVRQSFPATFAGGGEVNDLAVDHFTQTIPPVDESTVVSAPTNKLELPASKWGVPGGSEPVTMTRWYTNRRDIWVEPRTGTIVKEQEHPFIYYGRSADKPELTVLRANLNYDENTIESQIAKAKNGMDTLSLYGRVLPLGMGILGVIALISGCVYGWREPGSSDGGRHAAGGDGGNGGGGPGNDGDGGGDAGGGGADSDRDSYYPGDEAETAVLPTV